MNVLSDRPHSTRRVFDDEGPGELLTSGPRHDNDYSNFREIRILPTVDEILAINRSVYMPKKDVPINQPHLDHGVHRLLDTRFRHLRYDNTESLRDICYTAAQKVFLNDDFNTDDDEIFQETPAGNRYHLYSDLKPEELIAHEQKGMIVRLSFDCPPSLQGKLMHQSTRLQKGMLCAIMAMDLQTQELSVTYCDIHQRESTISMEPRGGGMRRAAVQVSFHKSAVHEDILYMTRLALGLGQCTRLVLVEFPKVLYAGFYHPLHRLQKMSVNEIAFQRYLVSQMPNVPGNPQSRSLHIDPPKYAQDPRFSYNLGSLTKDPLDTGPCTAFIGAAVPGSVVYMCQNSSLDEGQSLAFCNSLGREFSFIQGPPGTGKTFLGVALARVLLASRPSSNAKPLVVVCLTNHALDGFLAGLRDAGVEKLLRVGGGSKEDWTKSISLHEKAKKSRFGHGDVGTFRGICSQKRHVFAELDSWCKGVSRGIESGNPCWQQVEPVLKRNYPDVHQQLAATSSIAEMQSFAFDYWVAGGDLIHIDGLQKELSARLLNSAFSRSKNDGETIEKSLQDIALHAQILNKGERRHDIWHLDISKRDSLLAE